MPSLKRLRSFDCRESSDDSPGWPDAWNIPHRCTGKLGEQIVKNPLSSVRPGDNTCLLTNGDYFQLGNQVALRPAQRLQCSDCASKRIFGGRPLVQHDGNY